MRKAIFNSCPPWEDDEMDLKAKRRTRRECKRRDRRRDYMEDEDNWMLGADDKPANPG